MMWHAMASMGLWPAHTVVKVDDTIPGIGEGVAAGTWTVGVSLSGNMVGLTVEELASLPEAERTALRARATAEMLEAGADMVIELDRRSARRARPHRRRPRRRGAPRPATGLRQRLCKQRGRLLFVNKKKQKNFFKLGRAGFTATGPEE